MKIRISILLLAILAIICLLSCDGIISYDDSKYQVTYYDGNNSQTVELYSHDGYIPPVNKAGYKFIGYFTSDGLQHFDSNGYQLGSVRINSDITLYARLEPYKYTVELYSQDNDFEESSLKKTIEISYGDNLSQRLHSFINSPKYELDGYFDKSGLIRYSNGTESILSLDQYGDGEVIRMYAKYKVKELTITLNFNDGKTPPRQIKVNYGEPIGDLSEYAITEADRGVARWSTTLESETPLPNAITTDLTVYAIWESFMLVDFMFPNNEVKSIEVYVNPDRATRLPVDDIPGYRLEGWYTGEDLTGNPIFSVPYGELKNTYYGKWTEKTYTVTFDTCGNGEIRPIQYQYGDTVSLPAPEKKDYIFSGWKIDGSDKLFKSITEEMWGDLKLTAVYREKYILIYTEEQLKNIANNTEERYALACDIELTEVWSPIKSFSGELDGRGFKISNLILKNNSSDGLGFIISNSGAIKNLSFENVSVSFRYSNTSDASVGVATAYNRGTIADCHILSGTMSFDFNVQAKKQLNIGNIVGNNQDSGVISGCTAYASISGKNSGYTTAVVGGIAGYTRGEISKCYSEASITVESEYQCSVGGIVSVMDYESVCNESGANCEITVECNNSVDVGGFVGIKYGGTTKESYASGNISINGSGAYAYVGGFLGHIYNLRSTVNIVDCYSITQITSSGPYTAVGDFAGYITDGVMKNCIAYGESFVSSGIKGAFLGYGGGGVEITNCVATSGGSFCGRYSGALNNNASISDYPLENLFSNEIFYGKLLFSKNKWIINEENAPVLKWQTETEE